MISSEVTFPILPVTAAIIVNKKSQILIARRKQHLRNGGKWEFPGGKLKYNESPEDCLKREIKEELGALIEIIRPFHLVNHTFNNGSILLIGFLCKIVEENWQFNDHSEICWVTIENLAEYDFTKPDLPIVDRLIKEFS